MVWPLLARLAPELIIGGGFLAQSWMSGSKRKSVRLASAVPPTVGFAGAALLRPEYEDDWVEVSEAQGFNPRTWGRDLGGSPYGMGYR